ncbi:MAG: DUF2252 family protein [Methylocella sp.]
MPSRLIDPDARQDALAAAQRLKMARSPHAYVRGNTAQFYDWLRHLKRGHLPEGPPVWICGDCHVGNLGPLAHSDGRVEIQIRDLDQTVIGNPTHDLVRLGLSLASAARGSDLPGVITAHILEQLIEGYAGAMNPDRTGDEEDEVPEAMRLAVKTAIRRSWQHLAKERIENTKPAIPLGKRFWPLAAEEHSEITHLFEKEHVRQLATTLRSRKDNAPVGMLDAAYWKKGCSSLGKLRYCVLLGVGDKQLELCLMDLKEAAQAAAPADDSADMPEDQAQRVVEGARQLSPYLGERMRAIQLFGRSIFIRELLPQDLKIELETLTREQAMNIARFLANVVGKAHARQMDADTRSKWATELSRARTGDLKAPSWLWSSVVDLLAIHEKAYLEHCRLYALNEAR